MTKKGNEGSSFQYAKFSLADNKIGQYIGREVRDNKGFAIITTSIPAAAETVQAAAVMWLWG